jgi:catechol 2,3-dioxygenase-like lactoylglutathione lyase family enzyme
MTVLMPSVYAFHIGIVVHDLDATTRLYSELLGVTRWHYWENDREGLPTNPDTAGQRGAIRVAYGRLPGQTIELFQPLGGTTIWSNFLRNHGQGVQHIGFWTRDLAATLGAAVARGGKVVHAYLRDGVSAVQISPSTPDADLLPLLDATQLGYVDVPNAGGVLWEFMGSGGPQRMRDRMGESLLDVLELPPWLETGQS